MRARGASFILVPAIVGVAAFACDRAPPQAPVQGAPISAPISSARPTGPSVTTAEQRCARGERKLLDELRGEMTITGYLSRGVPELDALADRIQTALETLRRASSGKLTVRIVNPTTAVDRQAALDAGLLESVIGESPAGQSAAAKGFLGIVVTYGSEREPLKWMAAANHGGVELWVANKIRELRERVEHVKHRIGVLGGHDSVRIDEPNLLALGSGSPTLQKVIADYYPAYVFEDVDLTKGEREIDAELDGLIVLQPATDLLDSELLRIDRFVMRGKSLVVAASAANVARGDARMQATIDRHRIDLLLSGYGIEMGNDALVDFDHAYKLDVTTPGALTIVRFPQIPVVDGMGTTSEAPPLDSSHPAFFLLSELAFPFASSLELKPEHQANATFTILARSSPATEALSGHTADLAPFRVWKQSGGAARRVIAASVEGAIGPGLAGNTKAATADGAARAPTHSRVLAIASSQFFANPFVRAGVAQVSAPYAQTILTNMILAFKNTLDWMVDDEDLLACARAGRGSR